MAADEFIDLSEVLSLSTNKVELVAISSHSHYLREGEKGTGREDDTTMTNEDTGPYLQK